MRKVASVQRSDGNTHTLELLQNAILYGGCFWVSTVYLFDTGNILYLSRQALPFRWTPILISPRTAFSRLLYLFYILISNTSVSCEFDQFLLDRYSKQYYYSPSDYMSRLLLSFPFAFLRPVFLCFLSHSCSQLPWPSPVCVIALVQ